MKSSTSAHGTRRAMLAITALIAVIGLACTASVDEGAESPNDESAAPEAPAPPPDDLEEDFDRQAARANAQALIGLPEDAIEESTMRRIVRRGDEHFAVTMDLRPGRQNLELDNDSSGTYIVTKVIIETMDGEHLEIE